MPDILVVDDDKVMCELLSRILKKEGFEVLVENNPLEAVKSFKNNSFDIVVTDFYMPEMNGIELMNEIKKVDPEVHVIVMTAYASTSNAVEAIKKGAYDYIVKPFQNDELILTVKRVLEKKKLAEENRYLKKELFKKYNFQNIIGKSSNMEKIFALIEKVADSSATVILFGESGTGKELAARAIHFSSKRKNKRFVAINCSTLPDTLLESELFGHIKGSFTGASENKEGLFEYANEGTLFLDEIADTSPSVQAKLLRVIEEKKIRRLGENKEIEVDVRIITATSRNLKKLIDENLFREDLFYRINIFPLNIPPLRERGEDIPILIEHFLKGRKKVHPSAIDIFMNYNWPGNVRELENMVERVVIFSLTDTIMPDDLPDEIKGGNTKTIDFSLSYRDAKIKAVKEFNINFISSTLKQVNGNISKAAEKLKLDRANFQRLIRKYQIDSSKYKKD